MQQPQRLATAGVLVFLFGWAAIQAQTSPQPAAKEGLKALAEARASCAPYFEELLSKGKAVRTSETGLPALLPASPGSQTIRSAIAAEKPGILVETVFLLPRAAPSDESGLRAELAGIYGLLRSFASLEGIQYYSASHRAMRTLYAESYRIDDPVTRTRLPDPPPPPASAIPAAESLFALQRDLSFGSNVYGYNFLGIEGAVVVEVSNLSRMSYGILPIAAPGALKTRLFVVQAADAIIFYTESGAKAPGIFRARLEESFSNRAAALFAWFSAKSGAYLKPRP